ncbi:MAG: lysoplasmalogenase [Paracoccaceae bacterium]
MLETVCMMAGAGLAVAYGMAHAGEPASWAGSALKIGSVLALAAGGLAAGAPGLIVAGLFLGAAGDFCLSRSGDRWFLAGMAAFGAGHLAYVLALWHGLPGWVALAAVVALALSTEAWLIPRTGALRGPVRAYVLLISAMALAALGLGRTAPLIVAGAGLFLGSDMLLALDRFVLGPSATGRPALARLVWASYWIGQALILLGGVALTSG